MAKIYPGKGIDVNAIADGTLEEWTDAITISKVTVGGVKEIRITHPEMIAQISEVKYTIPAATVSVNTVDVPAFTTYYCYYKLIAGVMTFVTTTTHPDLVIPEVEDYVWLRAIRFKSVSDVATIELVQRQIMTHEEALHCLADFGYLLPPIFIFGFAPTFNTTTGTISTEAGYYRRLTGEMRTRIAITDGVLYEPAVNLSRADLTLISKYSDDSAITANKYVKLLVGVLVNAESDFDYIVNIQGKPTVEYVSAAEAWADSERKASIGFSSTRRSAVLPLAWVVIKKGDASTITYMDIRETGLVMANGGSAGVTDHGALLGLTDYIDHPGFLLTDGTRPLTGNLAVDSLITIDGVDISVHAANTTIHHAPITLSAEADAILALSTQAIDLDTQTANKVFAGPASGGAAKPTMRVLSSADISDFAAAALVAAPAVSLASSAAVLMDLTGQAISLDTQVKNTILAGPTTGINAVPTFRTLSHEDISDFHTQSVLDCPAVTLNAAVDSIFGLSTQQLTLDTQAMKTVLAGPTSGVDAVPAFRTLSSTDISDFATAALVAAPAVTLAASAAILMDLTGQAISLDAQNASTVLAGPVVGSSAAAPTFRQLNIQDIARPSGVLTLGNGVNADVALTAGTRVYSITGPTGAFSITGFTGGTDGAVLYLYNNVNQNLTITGETGTTAANRIVVTSGSSEVTNTYGVFTFFYIAGTINRWVLSGVIA